MHKNIREITKSLLLIFYLFLLFGCNKNDNAIKKTVANIDSTHSVDSTGAAIAQSPFALTYEQRQGKILFDKYCAICHGAEGKGDGFNAFNLDPRPKDLSEKHYMDAFTDAMLYQTISQGGKGTNKSVLMPGWGGTLNKQQITYLIAYVRILYR
jgi:mono/diheme cytochrome c family protein